jgi:TonB family protein
MPVRENSPISSVSVNPYVKKIESVCDMHRVPFGSAEDFAGFMGALHENKHLAMDFWALVARMSEEESGPFSSQSCEPAADQMLEVIVVGVTGRNVAEIAAGGSEQKQLVGKLASMLAGEDVQSPVVESVSSVESDKDIDNKGADGLRIGFAEEAAPPPTQLRSPVPPAPVRSQPEPAPVPPAPVRLQPERGPAPPAPVWPEPAPIRRYGESPRLVLEPEPLAAGSSTRQGVFAKAVFANDEYDDPTIRVPLAGYAEEGAKKSTSGFGLLLLLAVLAAGGAFVAKNIDPGIWQRYATVVRERFTAAVQGLEGRGGEKSAVDSSKSRAESSSIQADSVKSQAESSPVANDTGEGLPVAGAPASPDRASGTPGPKAAAPLAGVAPGDEGSSGQAIRQESRSLAPAVPPPAPVAKRQRSEAVAEPPVRPRSRVVEEAAEASTRGDGVGAPVAVSAAEMEANLISSRVPAYPDAARANRVEGRVVMQAVISKSGLVGHLRVIDGDPLLRSAASEAVSKWRYRPYMMNGEPVEVATTVSVDFRLDH